MLKLQDGLKGNRDWTESVLLKRIFDITFSLTALAVFAIPMLFIAVLVRLTSPGPVLYWSDRIGENNTVFKMPKFRTMKTDTPAVATHLLANSDLYLTAVGGFLRRASLDELPQIVSILVGQMSFVGPRPALFNQNDLIELRTQKGIHQLTPGLTGWAQINGRDELPIAVKVDFDEYYLKHGSFCLDIQILLKTFIPVLLRKGVKH